MYRLSTFSNFAVCVPCMSFKLLSTGWSNTTHMFRWWPPPLEQLLDNNPTFCPLSVFMCFVWISEQTAIISLYNTDWLVCITETECVYCAVRTGYLCFVWISEQTAIISLYSIDWLVCIGETECVYCAVRTGPLRTIQGNIHLWILGWNFPVMLRGGELRFQCCWARAATLAFRSILIESCFKE